MMTREAVSGPGVADRLKGLYSRALPGRLPTMRRYVLRFPACEAATRHQCATTVIGWIRARNIADSAAGPHLQGAAKPPAISSFVFGPVGVVSFFLSSGWFVVPTRMGKEKICESM